jgi:hypothetical protein
VAQINDENRSAFIELTLKFNWFQPRGGQLLHNNALADQPGSKETYNAKQKQSAGEAANPVKDPCIVIQEIAEEAAAREQCAHPER